MTLIDREAVCWARRASTLSHREWHVTICVGLSATSLIYAWIRANVEGAWLALVFLLAAFINFERLGLALLRLHTVPIEGERSAKVATVVFAAMGVAIVLSIGALR